MNWLEQKYIGLVSSRLRNYKRKSGGLFNFSCCFCGDSDTDRRKARGYMYSKNSKTLYHCHNCGVTYSCATFLKTLDYQLFSEFLLENLKDKKTPEQIDLEKFTEKMKKPVFLQSGPLKGLKKISQLKADHPMKKYVASRLIPNPFHAKMFFCPRFFEWCNEVVPGKFSKDALAHDESRLLIPFLSAEKHMHAFQGRSLDPKSSSKYITIINDPAVPKIYGLDEVDFNKRVYCFEGPIDSMFVPNSIATAGGDLVSGVKGVSKRNIVVCYDNEPRKSETREKLDKAILNGYSVCIWPSNLEHKDVNDMVLAGLTPEFIKYIIDANTCKDLEAKLKLNAWSKV